MADQDILITSSSEMRQKSSNWNLACDVELRQRLEQFSNQFQTKCEELMVKINDLDGKVNITSAKLGTVTNKLMLLSHNQFIESRVYEDEEIEEQVTKNESKYDVISKEESKNAIGNALLAGAKFMQTAFEIVHFDHEDSDDEEDEALEPIYESKNVYHSRKLPHIIGTQAFLSDEFIGLDHIQDIPKGDFSESSESSSDEEEEEDEVENDNIPIPMDNSKSEVINEEIDMVKNAVIVHTDSEYSDDYDEEKPTKVDLDSDHATDDQNNDTSNDGAAIEDEKEKPTNFMSELASKLGGPQQKKKDKAVVESIKPNEIENATSSRNDNKSKNKKDSAKPKSPSLNKKSLFDSDSESDDLFNPKPNAHQKTQKKSIKQVEKNDVNVNDESNPVEVSKNNETEKNIPNTTTEAIAPIMLPKPKNPMRLFEDSSDDESNNNSDDTDEKISIKSQTSKNSDFKSSSSVKSENIDHKNNLITRIIPVQKKSLFDDSSNEEEEENADLFNNKKVPNQDKKPFTIFDNDSDDEEYEKLFASTTKNSNNETTTENSKDENAQIDNLESEDESKDSVIQDQGEDDPDALKPTTLMRGLKKVLQKTVKSKNSNNKATEKNQDSDLKNEEPRAKTPQRKKSITKNEKPNLSEIKTPEKDTGKKLLIPEDNLAPSVLLSSVTKTRVGPKNRRRPTRSAKKPTNADIFSDTTNTSGTVLINEEVPDAEVEKTLLPTTILPSSPTLTALPTIVVPQVKQGNALLINELKKRVKDEVVLVVPQDKPSDDVKDIKNSETETEDVKILKDTPNNKDLMAMKSEKKVVPNSFLATSDDDTNSTKEAFVTPPNCEIADSQDKSDIKLQNGDVHQQHLEEKPKTSDSIPVNNAKKSNLFEDEDDNEQLFSSSTKTEKVIVKPPPGKSLFSGFSSSDSDDDLFTQLKKPAAPSEKSKTIQNIFDDDDDSDEDLFDLAKKGTK